jgi:hypothetical protein
MSIPIPISSLFTILSTKLYLLWYLFIAIIALYVILVAYIKIKLRFWKTQPVFHIYNLLYWLSPPGIINPQIPETENNNYMNHLAIKTYAIDDLADITLDQFCNFVKNYYAFHSFAQSSNSVHSFVQSSNSVHSFAQNYKSEYRPKKTDIIGYLKGTNHPSYISLYEEPHMLFQKGQVISSINTIKGVISARAINICIKGRGPSFPSYYVDNLCVLPEARKTGIAPELIQTHYYNLRKNNSRIKTCLFKREGDLTAIVPLTTFETYCYDLGNTKSVSVTVGVVEIGLPQLALLVDFIKSQQHKFDCVILPDLTNLVNMLKTGNISIYGRINSGVVSSIYVFRTIQLYYNGRRATECTLALYSNNKELFINGFTIALQKVKDKYKVDILLMEDTAQANCLIAHLGLPLLFKSPTAFFLYNYACYSISHRSFMILY